jgi:hypothetical protein
MLTGETFGIEYEIPQGKFSALTHHHHILVADNLATHTEILGRTRKVVNGTPGMNTEQIAPLCQTSSGIPRESSG